MPDYAPTATPRFRAFYRSAGFEHHMMLRYARGTSVSDVVTRGRNATGSLAVALQDLLPEDFQWLSIAYALQDSDVFIGDTALPIGSLSPAAPLSTYTPIMRGTNTQFKGTGGGSKVALNFFGLFYNPSDVSGPAANGQVDSGEDLSIAAAISALNSATGIYSIANSPASWYNFATVKSHDHYVKLARRLFP